MANPAAREGDQVVATDIHIVLVPTPGGPSPTPIPHPFSGKLDGSLSQDVSIDGKPAATLGSTATNSPSHVPQGGSFQVPPQNRGTVLAGSATVFINGMPAARVQDQVQTCFDVPGPLGSILTGSPTVFIGG